MKVLIVGSGGREHALCWMLAQSPLLDELYCTPGNAGIAEIATCVDINANDIEALYDFARGRHIDLAIIGPEAPLIRGIADYFSERGIPTFGPSKAAAQIEGSKIFSREITHKYSIPHPQFWVYDDADRASEFVTLFYSGSHPFDLVVKADGEALGKGVFPCSSLGECLSAIKTIMVDRAFGDAGNRILIEERLIGSEASIIVITDGQNIFPLVPVQDYKRAYDGDLGPMTGGMGGYAPIPELLPAAYDYTINTLVCPTLNAMEKEGCPFTGVLYTGIMLTKDGPKILEHNCRFGDPETQVSFPLLENDLLNLIDETLRGKLNGKRPIWKPDCSVSVVLASGGYPGSYEKGKLISGLDEAAKVPGVTIFHAGTTVKDGQVVTSGGRVLTVNAIASDFEVAIQLAYKAADMIDFEGKSCRRDIGQAALA